MFFAYAFNNVIAPCLVSLFQSTLCFNAIITAPGAIQQNFSYALLSQSQSGGGCVAFNSSAVVSQLGDDAPAPPTTVCYSFTDPASKLKGLSGPGRTQLDSSAKLGDGGSGGWWWW